jgi:hypothetical protein
MPIPTARLAIKAVPMLSLIPRKPITAKLQSIAMARGKAAIIPAIQDLLDKLTIINTISIEMAIEMIWAFTINSVTAPSMVAPPPINTRACLGKFAST